MSAQRSGVQRTGSKTGSTAAGNGASANGLNTPGNPNDPWAVSGNNYSPDNFYVRATDGNGHDSVIQVKVSPALLGEIQRLIQSRSIPQLSTNGALVRDALVHRLRYLHDHYDPAINLHSLEVEQRQAEIDRVRSERQGWEKLLADLDSALGDLIRYGELDEAEWLCQQNEYNESMTVPFLVRLNKTISKHRTEIESLRRTAMQ